MYRLLIAASVAFAIYDGAPVEDDAHPECVALGTARRWTCSGVLIAPDILVTAAHCLDEPITRMAIGDDPAFAQVVSIEGRAASIDRSLDIAVVRVPHDVRVRIATSDEIDRAQRLVLVGFGGRTAESNGGGIKRSRVARSSGGVPREGGCEFVRGAHRMAIGPGACRGDSGGGVYLENGALAGIITCFANGNNDCSNGPTVFVRADRIGGAGRSGGAAGPVERARRGIAPK